MTDEETETERQLPNKFEELIIKLLRNKTPVIVNGGIGEFSKDKQGNLLGGCAITELNTDYITLEIYDIESDTKKTKTVAYIPLSKIESIGTKPTKIGSLEGWEK